MASLVWLSGGLLGYWSTPPNLDQPIHYSNESELPVALYSERPDSAAIQAYLAPNESLELKYLGRTGEWIYLDHPIGTLTPRDERLEPGYRFYSLEFIKLSTVKKTLYVSVTALVLLVVALFRSRSSTHTSNRTQLESKLQAEQRKSQSLKTSLRIQREEYDKQIASLTAEARKNLKASRQRLEVAVRKESEQRLNSTIEEMESSYTRLEQEYSDFKKEARLFGVDRDDPRYDSLLKGRQYEIYVAKALVQKSDFKILEWTPDKGFDEGVPVESNTNPDLVVESVTGTQIAIECKYRSQSYKSRKTGKQLIGWSYYSQVGRYESFQTKRKMSVYVAIGIDGQATLPKKNYLISLDDLSERSFESKRFAKKQVTIGLSDLYEYYVEGGRYGFALFSILKRFNSR